jgi:hypothetical protein
MSQHLKPSVIAVVYRSKITNQPTNQPTIVTERRRCTAPGRSTLDSLCIENPFGQFRNLRPPESPSRRHCPEVAQCSSSFETRWLAAPPQRDVSAALAKGQCYWWGLVPGPAQRTWPDIPPPKEQSNVTDCDSPRYLDPSWTTTSTCVGRKHRRKRTQEGKSTHLM